MQIPNNFALTVNDIRHLRHIQLARLTGVDPSNFVAWSKQRTISESSLANIAQRIGISKADLLEALELRRQDAAIARQARDKAAQLIAYLESQELA